MKQTKRTRASRKRKPRTYRRGCYQHYATVPGCDMCATYADIAGLPMPSGSLMWRKLAGGRV